MNGKAWTANPLLLGMLWLALGVPCAFAADAAGTADAKQGDAQQNDAKPGGAADVRKGDTAPCVPKPFDVSNAHKEHDMSPAAKLLPEPPDPTWFKSDPCYPEDYDSKAELDIYGGRHAIDRPRPPVELGLRLYDYGAYPPRPTLLGEKNPMMPAFIVAGDFRVAATQNDEIGRASCRE